MGVRTERYKLIFFYGLSLDATGAIPIMETPAGIELYDWVQDPQEMRNVYQDPSYAQTAAEMRRLFLKAMRETEDDISKYPKLQALIHQHFPEYNG